MPLTIEQRIGLAVDRWMLEQMQAQDGMVTPENVDTVLRALAAVSDGVLEQAKARMTKGGKGGH